MGVSDELSISPQEWLSLCSVLGCWSLSVSQLTWISGFWTMLVSWRLSTWAVFSKLSMFSFRSRVAVHKKASLSANRFWDETGRWLQKFGIREFYKRILSENEIP